jgi:porphobilinogen synthase
VSLGIKSVILFGIPEAKDPLGLESFAEDAPVQRAVRRLKETAPELTVITDVCLCEYTDSGHCGLLDEEGYVLNDETLEILGRVAVSHAQVGADVVAPSGMIDGMVAALRTALDGEGFPNVAILSYAVKYASAFYKPFGEAAEGAPRFGDRKTHQMDPANAREAIREVALDVDEGADALLVKPTAANGWLDERAAVLEILTGIRRAGADFVLTYHAKDAAAWLQERM